MYSTPSGERVHIGIFGRRNVGKSSLLNAISAQPSAIVSDTPGTTTDPVKRVMELLPLGPVVLIDTPGLDDEGDLGRLRVGQTEKILNQVDMALFVMDAKREPESRESRLLQQLEQKKVPYIMVYNKADLYGTENEKSSLEMSSQSGQQMSSCKASISVSADTGYHIYELKELMAKLLPEARTRRPLIADLISSGDRVVLVTPIDQAAPRDRLILPQQMTLREALDCHAIAMVVQDTELSEALRSLNGKPALVVTDSQAFERVMNIVPEDVPLTSFSILMARKKGNLFQMVSGAKKLDCLQDGDRVLICEGCTHHRQCDDIGTVKLPAWIKNHSGKSCEFEFTSGLGFPEDLSGYALVVHCGGCMLNDRELMRRQQQAEKQNIPMTNYGTAIAHMNGILERSLFFYRDVFGSG